MGVPEVGDTSSFQSWHIMVHFYLMLQQIEDGMDEKWIEMEEFKDFVSTLDNLDNN